MSRPDLGRALALVGARLRGDAEGERVLLGDGSEDRQLVTGLLALCEIAFERAAVFDGRGREAAAEMAEQTLRRFLADGTTR
jgi:hypothetical protein